MTNIFDRRKKIDELEGLATELPVVTENTVKYVYNKSLYVEGYFRDISRQLNEKDSVITSLLFVWSKNFSVEQPVLHTLILVYEMLRESVHYQK